MVGRAHPIALAIAVGLTLAWAASAFAKTPTDDLLERLKPEGPVSDFASLLTPDDRRAILERLEAVEKKTGAQIAVVTLKTLEGGQIDDFANKLFQRWAIGQKGQNNGVLMLIAVKDRKARIEVGYGLEPILPDALAGRVLDDELFPEFRKQNYSSGLKRGVLRVAEIIEKNEPAPRLLDRGKPAGSIVGGLLFFGLFVAIGWYVLGFGAGARQAFVMLWGGFFGGIPLFMALNFVGRAWPILPLIAIPLAIRGYLDGRKPPSGNAARRRARGRPDRNWGGGTWSWGDGTFGGGVGGGGFSSGGFGGFGGGSSGGGGASGGW